MRKSIWEVETKLPEFKKLNGDIKTDVLIIGGGMCGILCAYFLQKQGVDYVLAEGGRIASGITKNTTAKITSQHGLIYNKIIKSYGREYAKMYLEANEKAIKIYKKLSESFDFDYEEKKAYTYSLYDSKRIEDEVRVVNDLGFPAQLQHDLELPFETMGAVCFPGQAQFNPLKFICAVAENLNIYENTFIKEINDHVAVGDGFTIKAKKIIVATHFPFINKHGAYFLKLYQHRSYVSAYKNIPVIDGMYVDEDKKGMSFRSYKDYVLVGGGGHRTGKQGGAWGEIDGFQKKHFPKAQLCYQWATQDCMSLDGIPYIGNYSASTPDLYVAAGFNKWGMTSSMVSALVLKDMVMDRKNDFEEVFNPSRSILKPQLFANGAETSVNLLFPATRRCSHLGCALKWNRAEHTWDCACHGSRFDKSGKVINNPAIRNIDNV